MIGVVFTLWLRFPTRAQCSLFCTHHTGLGNLAARWPRHIVEAIRQQDIRDNPDGFTTLAASPVGPSMSSVPPDPTGKVGADKINLQATPGAGERHDAKAESPLTAMDIATSRGIPQRIRGISIPRKPDPPGAEGERRKGGCDKRRLS